MDENTRTLYFLGVGLEKGRDPYFQHLYRIGMDGKNRVLLTPEDANHDVTLSPSGKYFVDSYSKPDAPPSPSPATTPGSWWRRSSAPTSRSCSRPDGSRRSRSPSRRATAQTDLYGLMYQPTHLDPNRKYPIINHIYPGPQTGSVRGRNFSPARGDCQAIAELGFIVVEIDGMGTPWRSKKFHEAYYGEHGGQHASRTRSPA